MVITSLTTTLSLTMYTLYNTPNVKHIYYKFPKNATKKDNQTIVFIPEDKLNDYKFCETCDICYKKKTFNSHKKQKFHCEKQVIIDNKMRKGLTENNLYKTIDNLLDQQLKNNDINIADIICDHLKDTCNVCKEKTINPGIYHIDKKPINICQYCLDKNGTRREYNYKTDCWQNVMVACPWMMDYKK